MPDANGYPTISDLLGGMMPRGTMEQPKVDVIRCPSCKHARPTQYIEVKGVKYKEQEGARCERCNTRMGGPSEEDLEFALLLKREQSRIEVEEVADTIAEFGTALQDAGLDSFAVAQLCTHFAIGNITPGDVTRWRRDLK